MRPAAFVDRDGTLIEEIGYLSDLSRLRLFPYSVDAVRQLNRAGLAVVVITNQSGIARGIVSEAFVHEAHRHLSSLFEAGGARIDGYYYCPHHPEATVPELRRKCECRKPAPGLWMRAAGELGLDLARSFTIGDKSSDIQAGRAAGTRTVLVRTGYGARVSSEADAAVENLAAASGWILQQIRA